MRICYLPLGGPCIVKNYDRGLENAALFQARGLTFSLYVSTLSPSNNIFILAYGKLDYKWVSLHNFIFKLAYMRAAGLPTHWLNERTSELLRYWADQDVLKNSLFQTTLCQLHLALIISSPKIFDDLRFRAKFETTSLCRCESLEIRLFYRKLSGRKQRNSLYEFHKKSLNKYSKKNTGLRANTASSYKQSLTISKHLIEFKGEQVQTYVDYR